MEGPGSRHQGRTVKVEMPRLEERPTPRQSGAVISFLEGELVWGDACVFCCVWVWEYDDVLVMDRGQLV